MTVTTEEKQGKKGSIKFSRLPIVGDLIRGLFWEIPAVLALRERRCKPSPVTEKRKLLILKLDAIGDFLLFLGCMREIRKIYAPHEWEITLLGNQLWKDLAVALDVADHYHFADLRLFEINPLYRLRTLLWVSSMCFDTVIQGVYSRAFYRDDLMVRVSEAPRRIGYVGDAYNSPSAWLIRGNKYYTDLVEPQVTGSLHILQTHAKFAASVGGIESVYLPTLPLNQLQVGRLAAQIGGQYFVMVPGGSARIRQWPSESFAGLAEFIHSQTGFRPIILGGKRDGNVALQVIAAAPSLPWLDLCDQTSLMEAVAIISGARFYVGNDTGLTHAATMARVPTLAIVGGAFPGRDFPYPDGIAPNLITVCNLPPCKGCGWRCNYQVNGRAECVHDISLDHVISRMESFWSLFSPS